MAFEGRFRDTQRGGFGGGATSTTPSVDGAASVSDVDPVGVEQCLV